MRGIDNPMAKADSDDSPRQTIANALHEESTIKGFGRRQHGLNGKDADLDNGGQCVVRGLYVYEDKTGLRLGANLNLYANVCEPTDDDDSRKDKYMKEIATEIVCDETRYDGEWTGSDYWSFHINIEASCHITEAEYDDDGRSQKMLERIAERLVKAINANPEVPAFEKAMCDLNNAINELHKEDFGQFDTPKQMGWVGGDGRP